MNERRVARIEALIQQRVAEVIDRELKDPRRGLITVTKVRVDRELLTCKVYWSVLGGDADRARNERVLDGARGFVQREIAAVLRTRSVPRVSFAFDESISGAIRMQQVLDDLAAERAARPEAVEPPAADDGGGDFP
jgi:ribosome-binding factor A